MKITTLTNPRQVVLVTSSYKNKDNVITLDWHTPLSFDPMLYAIAVAKVRFSCELIKKSKVFIVNFMSTDYEKEILYCGRHSGRDLDKFKSTGLTREKAEKILCPRLREALAFLECQVIKEIETGDHILFIGKVVNYQLKKKGKRLFHLWADKFTTTKE